MKKFDDDKQPEVNMHWLLRIVRHPLFIQIVASVICSAVRNRATGRYGNERPEGMGRDGDAG